VADTAMADTAMADTAMADTATADTTTADTAWSQCDEPPALTAHHDWHRVLRLACVVVLVAVGTVGAAVAFTVGAHVEKVTAVPPPPAMAASELPPISTEAADPPPFVMPTVMAEQQTADGAYLTGLTRAGLNPGPQAAAIDDGHKACHDLATYGYTTAQLAAVIAPQFKHLTLAQVNVFVASAVAAYCPQFTNRP
jgi:hypothetical protein